MLLFSIGQFMWLVPFYKYERCKFKGLSNSGIDQGFFFFISIHQNPSLHSLNRPDKYIVPSRIKGNK